MCLSLDSACVVVSRIASYRVGTVEADVAIEFLLRVDARDFMFLSCMVGGGEESMKLLRFIYIENHDNTESPFLLGHGLKTINSPLGSDGECWGVGLCKRMLDLLQKGFMITVQGSVRIIGGARFGWDAAENVARSPTNDWRVLACFVARAEWPSFDLQYHYRVVAFFRGFGDYELDLVNVGSMPRVGG